MSKLFFPLLCGVILAAAVPAFAADALPVTITVDAGKSTGKLNPIWRWCGYDEPNYTYAPNGKKLIDDIVGGKDNRFGPASFRAHNLLVTGDGTPRLKWGSTNAYTEDKDGKPVYDWTILDRIFDTYINAGAQPYAQIGFMPKALSLRPDPYEHNWKPAGGGNLFTGWTSPPNDYDKWRELNYQWARHCLERYGKDEVNKWRWEVWNEPNIGYFTAAVAGDNKVVDYEKVWDYAADGIRKAIPDAIIGGAECAGDGGQFQNAFIEHCLNGTNYATGQKGSRLGLISFHAKGDPGTTAAYRQRGHVEMGLANQLATVRAGFRIVTSRPETAHLPVVIGESDPDGCAACQSAGRLYPELGYRNTALFASYTIEQITRTLDLADQMKVNIIGAVTWAFEFEDQPIFGGFRALSTDGVNLPVLNTFKMLNKMGTQRLDMKSTGDLGVDYIVATPGGRGTPMQGVRGDKPDVSALASRDEKRVTVIAWNYHDDDVPGPAADISLEVKGLPGDLTKVKVTEWGVDETHSNSFTAWKKMGSPAKPTDQQHKQLEAASELEQLLPPADLAAKDGAATVKLTIPRQGVTLVELSW